MKFFVLLFLFGLFLWYPTPLYAQTEAAQPAFNQAYIQEMYDVYYECTGDQNLNNYYDCRCFAVDFLKERLVRGPDYPRLNILANLPNSCPNTAGIAGMKYQECLRMNGGSGRYDCECFANEFANAFSARPDGGLRNIQRLNTDAYTQCRIRR